MKKVEVTPIRNKQKISNEARKQTKKLTGKIVSDKMDKTCVVLITEKLSHPMYGKVYLKNRKLKAHDEKNEYKTGDMVEIAETRPFSGSTAWEVKRAVK